MPSLQLAVNALAENFSPLFQSLVSLAILMAISAIAHKKSGDDDKTRSKVLDVCCNIFFVGWVIAFVLFFFSSSINIWRAILLK